ncbi:MAG: hypothetical protein J2P15_18575, partial [Micromonosporaceae bacterium]|nr:hypothetical protein [Micromonosporaceae bacterium]
ADQVAAAAALSEAVRDVYQDAGAAAAEAMGQGELMRGEALTRWRSLVGAAARPHTLLARVERTRARVAITLTRRGPGSDFVDALCQAMAALVRDTVADADARVRSDWRWLAGGAELLVRTPTDQSTLADLERRAHRAVRDWHRALVSRVAGEMAASRLGRSPGHAARSATKVRPYTAHAAALQVAVAIFAPNPDEVDRPGIDPLRPDEVRELADWAVAELLARVQALLSADADRYLSLLDSAGVVPDGAQRLRAAAAAVSGAAAERRQAEGGEPA